VSDLFAAPADLQVVAEDPEQVIEEVSHPPVLITEQAVALSTAAAVSLPRTKPSHSVIAALRGMFVRSSADAPTTPDYCPPRHYPPRRDAFLDHASMAREMRRL
jgi:hypothetical protein